MSEYWATVYLLMFIIGASLLVGCASPRLAAKVKSLETQMEDMQMQISELAASLQELADQGTKVKAEVTEKIDGMQTQIDDLKAQLEAGAVVPAEAVSVLDALKVKLQEIDDIVPDPAPEPEPTPEEPPVE